MYLSYKWHQLDEDYGNEINVVKTKLGFGRLTIYSCLA